MCTVSYTHLSERLRALSSFLEQTHFPETACEQTNELYRQGAAQAAQEQEQLYEILLTAMEQAELVLGGQEMELELFLQMFRICLLYTSRKKNHIHL